MNPFIQMAYASVAPCSSAIAIYKSISETTTSPDSLRALAYKQLGDYYYVSNSYLRAIEQYRYASKYGKDPVYKHNWALAAYVSGDSASAKSLWHTLTLEHGDTIAEIANYHLGLLYTKRKLYQDAFNCFDKTGTPSASKPWAVASLQGKIDCAKKLGQNDKAANIDRQLDPWRDHLLEKGFSSSAAAAPVSKTATAEETTPVNDTASEKPDSLKRFTLQIGAFSSKENALGLEQRLEALFPEVTTSQFSIDNKVFYRVWVGSFKSKDSASAFGSDSLAKKGFSFRIVEK